MIPIAAGLFLLALLLPPHLLPRAALRPESGIALFLAALTLRAAVVLSVAVMAVLALPSTSACRSSRPTSVLTVTPLGMLPS